jgi:hypothetical protein
MHGEGEGRSGLSVGENGWLGVCSPDLQPGDTPDAADEGDQLEKEAGWAIW